MPLSKGTSKETISQNIREMKESGHSKDQSVAAALDTARRSGADIPKPKQYGVNITPDGKLAQGTENKDQSQQSYGRSGG